MSSGHAALRKRGPGANDVAAAGHPDAVGASGVAVDEWRLNYGVIAAIHAVLCAVCVALYYMSTTSVSWKGYWVGVSG